jgi:glycogen synthase
VVALLAEGLTPEPLAVAVAAALEQDLQLVVLGPESLRAAVRRSEACRTPLAFRATQGDADLRQVLAGADAAIFPAACAPGARLARIALRYAVVPVARRIPAHRDVLVEYDAASGTGGSFLFDDDAELGSALGRMCAAFDEGEAWLAMASRNAAVDSSWTRSVALLDEIYRKALAR